MIDRLPERLDLLATAEAGRVLRGPIALAQLERVRPLLASDAGELQVRLELGKDPAGIRYLQGTIRGVVTLTCQRCLEPMTQSLDLSFRLGMVTDEAAASHLPDRYEALLVGSEPARLADIVTDEVLLALPLVALHTDDSQCRGVLKDYQSSQETARRNPFAILEKLKQKQP